MVRTGILVFWNSLLVAKQTQPRISISVVSISRADPSQHPLLDPAVWSLVLSVEAHRQLVHQKVLWRHRPYEHRSCQQRPYRRQPRQPLHLLVVQATFPSILSVVAWAGAELGLALLEPLAYIPMRGTLNVFEIREAQRD